MLESLKGPIALTEFTDRVLELWPSQAKDPAAGIRQALRDEYAGRMLAFLDRKTIAPLAVALRGVRFRIPLSRQEANTCTEPGEIGALLHREGIYSSYLSRWRKVRDQGLLEDGKDRKRGPKAPANKEMGEYMGGYQEAGFPDLLTPASQGNLESLARRTRALDEKV